jgi:hypothetical protein
VVRTLLTRGAGGGGESGDRTLALALRLAEERGHSEAAALLRDPGALRAVPAAEEASGAAAPSVCAAAGVAAVAASAAAARPVSRSSSDSDSE